jgi:succinoglycan biosynthesis protein ExoV
MKLYYHKGKNFGDAINPIIFNHYLGNLLNQDDTEIILGIGSILGLFTKPENCKKVYVFTSGFGGNDESTYGKVPVLNKSFEIICVRGKKTAEALSISESYALTDGALLLPLVKPLPHKEKKIDFAYMPHVGSLNVYDKWKSLLQSVNIKLIDPRSTPNEIIDELSQTKVLLTEAMHGAIISDAYQIPWVAVKTIKTINQFKWQDYLETVNQIYSPQNTPTLYSRQFLNDLFKSKLKRLSFLSPFFSNLYYIYQTIFVVPKVKNLFKQLKTSSTQCCDKEILTQKQNALIEKMNLLKHKISH